MILHVCFGSLSNFRPFYYSIAELLHMLLCSYMWRRVCGLQPCVWQCVCRGWVMMCVMNTNRDRAGIPKWRLCLINRVCLCRHVNPRSLLKTGYELIWSDTRTRFPATSVANFSPLLTSQITWGSTTNHSITSATSATAVSHWLFHVWLPFIIIILLSVYFNCLWICIFKYDVIQTANIWGQ